jgi:predicted Fe-Mo cluster-binding NifX family protein
MKIAVSSTGGSLDAQIDPRFGRCPYFVIVNSETMTGEKVANTASGAMSGAGIHAAQLVANKGAQAVLTGNVGPNAFQALSAAGINIITGVSGTVKEAVEQFKSGQLETITAPTTPMGYGTGGYGLGMGKGRGGGRGGRRGMGFRRWQTTAPFPQAPMSPVSPTPPQMSKEQEIQILEGQMESIQRNWIRSRRG